MFKFKFMIPVAMFMSGMIYVYVDSLKQDIVIHYFRNNNNDIPIISGEDSKKVIQDAFPSSTNINAILNVYEGGDSFLPMLGNNGKISMGQAKSVHQCFMNCLENPDDCKQKLVDLDRWSEPSQHWNPFRTRAINIFAYSWMYRGQGFYRSWVGSVIKDSRNGFVTFLPTDRSYRTHITNKNLYLRVFLHELGHSLNITEVFGSNGNNDLRKSKYMACNNQNQNEGVKAGTLMLQVDDVDTDKFCYEYGECLESYLKNCKDYALPDWNSMYKDDRAVINYCKEYAKSNGKHPGCSILQVANRQQGDSLGPIGTWQFFDGKKEYSRYERVNFLITLDQVILESIVSEHDWKSQFQIKFKGEEVFHDLDLYDEFIMQDGGHHQVLLYLPGDFVNEHFQPDGEQEINLTIESILFKSASFIGEVYSINNNDYQSNSIVIVDKGLNKEFIGENEYISSEEFDQLLANADYSGFKIENIANIVMGYEKIKEPQLRSLFLYRLADAVELNSYTQLCLQTQNEFNQYYVEAIKKAITLHDSLESIDPDLVDIFTRFKIIFDRYKLEEILDRDREDKYAEKYLEILRQDRFAKYYQFIDTGYLQ